MEKFLLIYYTSANGTEFAFVETDLPDSSDPADFDLTEDAEILAVIGTETLSASAAVDIESLDIYLGGIKVNPT